MTRQIDRSWIHIKLLVADPNSSLLGDCSILPLHPLDVHKPSSKPSVHIEMNQSPLRTTWASHFPGTTLHKNWYTDPNIPAPWSTDWDDWEGLCLFYESVGGRLKIDKLFNEVYDVPGPIEPLAYMVQTSFEFFVFTAGGRYYFFDDGCSFVSDGEFQSHQHFLEEVLRPEGSMPSIEMQRRAGSDLGWLS
ncbi:hypothetical protein C8R44DRAFT_883840 [Mycena epipterygia]|nr:hypothetical protein C8R44DRAFT_883840 [Mycena epipterygia]